MLNSQVKKLTGKSVKIAFIGQKGIPVQSGGVERRVEELSVRLAQMGHEVFVYARKNPNSEMPRKYKDVNLIYLSHIPTKNLGTISHTFLATIHALFQDFDVIHYQAPGPSSLCWIIKWLKPRTALIATFNSRDSQHQKWGWLARAYLNLGERIISKMPDKTIVVSEILKKYVREKFGEDSLVVHNGASVKETCQRKELLRLDLEENRYFLSVSRLIRHKGIHHLIRAFSQAQKERMIPDNFKLAIVGDGSYTDDYVDHLKKIGRKNKNIVFAGVQTGENLAQFYSGAYAFVQPSEAEGLSNALLEAMGYGLPVIVSDIPENLLPVENFGLIFKNGDSNDLKDKLVFAVENKEFIKKLGREAKNRVERHYNWDKNAEKTAEIYEEIVFAKKGYFGKLLPQRLV